MYRDRCADALAHGIARVEEREHGVDVHCPVSPSVSAKSMKDVRLGRMVEMAMKMKLCGITAYYHSMSIDGEEKEIDRERGGTDGYCGCDGY